MEQIIERVKSIIMSPKDALNAVRTEEMTVVTTMKDYVAIVAAVPAVARFIGMAIIGLPLVGRSSFGRSFVYALVSYLLTLVSVVIVGKIIDFLAPRFNAVKNDINAFKLAVYSLTPGLVAGVFSLIPSLGILAFLGSLYGIYILYLGLPILMEVPQEKAVAYTVVTIIAVIVVMVVIAAIAGAIAWSGGGGPARLY